MSNRGENMKLLKVFNGEQPLFVEENNKKYKKNLNEINKLINALCTKYNEYSEFLTSPAHTEEIALAKGLNELFNTKRLRLDLVLENQRRAESAHRGYSRRKNRGVRGR